MNIELIFALVAIVLLLLLSALFSGSETALTAASRAQMHQLAKSGNRQARRVNVLIRRRERLIGGILLGNNLVNILASALATSILITIFGDAGVAYATVIMTALVLIFAEVLPKTYALHDPNRLALAVAPVIGLVVVTLSPVVRLVQGVVGATLRILGVDIEGRGRLVSPSDELRGELDLHTREGRMVKSDRDMLGSILDLPDVQVSEIMVHRKNMAMIDADQSPSMIVAEALNSPYTRIPLWREDPENIIGVLHAKDLLREISQHPGELDAVDITALARAPWFVPETTVLIEQLNTFRERREHFALVVDEYGALMGLVTLEDILEEIVGEIADEHDIIAAQQMRPEADGALTVDGTVAVRALNRHYDWDLPDDEAATVAGLVIHEARKIPDVGETFTVHGFQFDVLRRKGNQIATLRVRPPAED